MIWAWERSGAGIREHRDIGVEADEDALDDGFARTIWKINLSDSRIKILLQLDLRGQTSMI